ncbi:MAG: [Fe-Fe] hydrogenase large subunit C-terminal domain-containing protein, partial [Bacillota bacterium]
QIYVVSIMPCTAKKFEAARPEFATDGVRDVDLVLTTQELGQMLRESGLDFKQLEPDAFDMPFGFTTGAGVLFGASGGVTEAALRAAYEMATGKMLEQVNFKAVRGFAGLKETTVNLDGREMKIAVVQGLNNAKSLLKRIKSGEASYHMIEVMACPGGCISGAGQPINTNLEAKKARAKGIYRADTLSQLRKSQDNPIVAKFYEKWLDKPNSREAHHTLHTGYSTRARISGTEIELLQSRATNKVDVAVCVGTCCYLNGSYDTLQEFMKQAEQAGIRDRINLHATFCMEGCESGPSIRINDEVIGGVTADKVAAVIKEKILKN